MTDEQALAPMPLAKVNGRVIRARIFVEGHRRSFKTVDEAIAFADSLDPIPEPEPPTLLTA